MLSATAFACPQGTALTGGSGPNHKGGKCVATAPMTKQHKMMKHEKMAAQAKVVKPASTTAHNMADKSHKEAQVVKTAGTKAEVQKAVKTS